MLEINATSNAIIGMNPLDAGTFIIRRDRSAHTKGYFALVHGERFDIEKELTAPFLDLTEPQYPEAETKWMLCPYTAEGQLVPWANIAEHYSKAAQYLKAIAGRLIGSIQQGVIKEDLHAYCSPQAVRQLTEEKYLTMPYLVGIANMPRVVDLSYLTQNYGRVLFGGGYLIPVKQETESLVKFIQSPEFPKYLLENKTSFELKNGLFCTNVEPSELENLKRLC